MELKIEYLDKTALKPYVNNAKIHTNGQVEQIRKSIEEFDFNDPIAVWGENEIVEGHGRLLAAMEMDDIDTVPVIRLDHLTDKQRKAYALAHNKLTMNTDFDLDLLAQEVADLDGTLDLTDFGFNEAELLELQIDDSPEIPQYTPREEAAVPVAQAGDGEYVPVSPYGGQQGVFGGQAETPPYIPEGAAKEDLAAYAEHAAELVTRRVIIIYRNDEEEKIVKDLLGVPQEEKLKVIYIASDIKAAEES